MKIYFKPEYSNLFKKIKNINTPIKNDLLIAFLDGRWHSENEIIKVIKKKYKYIGPVTLASMTSSFNRDFKINNYLQKKIIDGQIFYKLSDNYKNLTRVAFTKYRFAEM